METTTPPQATSNQELAMFTIVISVKSDEQAIDIKKKISDVLKDIPDVRMDFRIMTTPPKHMWPT